MLSRCPRKQRGERKRNIGGDGNETRTQEDARPSRIPSHARRGRDRRGRRRHAAGGCGSRRQRKHREEEQVSAPRNNARGSNILTRETGAGLGETPAVATR